MICKRLVNDVKSYTFAGNFLNKSYPKVFHRSCGKLLWKTILLIVQTIDFQMTFSTLHIQVASENENF